MRLVAEDVLTEACDALGVRLPALIASTTIWASPGVVQALEADGGCWYPGTRRYRVGAGEKKGEIKDGVRLDDNTYANYAIKRAIGLSHAAVKGFAVCHIWPGTTYDERYHTAIQNLVLVPAQLAGLTDHDAGVEASLTFRAYELYGWHPTEAAPPQRPADYPSTWREPMPFNEGARSFLRRRRPR